MPFLLRVPAQAIGRGMTEAIRILYMSCCGSWEASRIMDAAVEIPGRILTPGASAYGAVLFDPDVSGSRNRGGEQKHQHDQVEGKGPDSQ